jgi:hypothetical protein
MRVFVVLVAMVLSAAASQAQARNPYLGEPGDFLGTWTNIEAQRTMVTRIEIRPDGPRVRVIVFGLRNGEPCIFGEYRGRFFLSKYPKEREQDNSAVLVKVEHEWVHGHVLLRFNGQGEIVSHSLLAFAERGDVYSVERFASSYRDRGEPDEDYRRYRRPYPSYRGY